MATVVVRGSVGNRSLKPNKSTLWQLPGLLFAAGLLSACVSPPFVTDGVSKGVLPADVLEQAEGAEAVGKVLWGGVVVSSANTSTGTEIEILSYPLDYLQRPNAARRSSGRFLVVVDDFIETTDFEAGRRVTAVGTVTGTETGKIGESDYRYPVLKLAAPADIHRWSAQEYYNSSPVSVGIGISISN